MEAQTLVRLIHDFDTRRRSREHVQDVELMMAGAAITVMPVLLLFLALQRYHVRGLLAVSVKG
jgi:multiple sugar transport system permease protein